MRHIAFRAWAVDRGMIYPPFNIFIKESDAMLMQEGGYFGYHGSSVTLLQFTERHDKNGTEIYEGDVLSDGKYRAAVEYVPSEFCAMADMEAHDCVTNLLAGAESMAEVIGNIFENPELLKDAA